MTWAFSLELRPSPLKFLLLALADHADGHGRAFPSVAALCEKTSQDRKTVIAGIDELERLGLLADTGDRVGKTKQVKVYRITADEAIEPAVRKHPETGILPNPNGPVAPAEGSRISAERVPQTGHGSVMDPSKEPQSARPAPEAGPREELGYQAPEGTLSRALRDREKPPTGRQPNMDAEFKARFGVTPAEAHAMRQEVKP